MTRRPRFRKTKLIATIGPACDSLEVLEAMIRAGMNVARLNLSHGTQAEHEKRIERIRRAGDALGVNVATMVDTRGIEIRTGLVAGGSADLVAGHPFSLFGDERLGDASGVSISYPGLIRETSRNDHILIDDGKIELIVEAVEEAEILCRVRRGGGLGNKKGVNRPADERVERDATTEDREDLAFAARNQVDYVAASFVQTAADVERTRSLLVEFGADTPVIAKIENRTGVDHLEEIVAAADGIMVARGDLGVQIPVEVVPTVQKKIIHNTVMNGKPVITATQMLDSMERNPRPTRAEVSDVANAIYDGTSAVMLSGETAAGRFPLEAVRTMSALAIEAEAALRDYGHLQHILPSPSNVVTEAVSQAAITMAHHLEAAAILTLTETGFTSRSISKYRPACPIVAITSAQPVVRRLAMNWGVTAVYSQAGADDDAKIAQALRHGRDFGFVEPGDVVVATGGQHQQAGSTNMIRVVTVE